MKRSILLLAFFVMLAIPAIPQVFTSDFESWVGNVPTNWVGDKTSLEADSISPYTTNVHGGTYACKLVNRQLTTSNHKRFTTQPVSITSGDIYNITFWVRGHGFIRTGLYDGGTTYTYNSYIEVNSSSWTQQTQSVSAGSTSTAAEFIFSIHSTVSDLDDIQIDDVTITTGTATEVSIYDIQYSTASPADSPYNGQIISTGGIVTGKYENGYNSGFFMQSGSGLWNGVLVYCDSATVTGVDRGDSLTLTASVYEYYNLTELKSVTNLVKVSSGNAEPSPYAVTGANSKTEGIEGVLVKITDAACVVAPNSFGEWALFDTDSTFVDNLMYSYTAVVGTHYDVTGPVTYSYGQFFIEPRDAADVVVSTGITETSVNNFNIYPNPVSDVIYINNMDGINMVKITNLLGQNIQQTPVTGSNAMINISKLPRGIYFVSLVNEQGIQSTQKFIKE